MEYYELHPENPQERFINKAVEILKKGGVIIYPTDTVYALGCDVYNHKAVKRIYEIKNETKTKLFSFLIPNLKNIAKYAKVSDYAYKTIKRLVPGPYTFVLPASKEIPKKLWTKRRNSKEGDYDGNRTRKSDSYREENSRNHESIRRERKGTCAKNRD